MGISPVTLKSASFSIFQPLYSLFLPLQYSAKALSNSLGKAAVQTYFTRVPASLISRSNKVWQNKTKLN